MCCRRRDTDSPVVANANSEQLLMSRQCCTLFHRLGPVVRPYSSHCLWTRLLVACYHIHRYVALSVIGHRMCNRISGLCDKSSITKRYRELTCCLYGFIYYSCCALVIIRGNQLVIFPGIALYYGNTYYNNWC